MSTDPGLARSDYLRYLPSVLWDTGAAPGDFSLNRLLLALEKILTGIDDGEPVVHSAAGTPTHTHDGIEAVIDRLHLLLDPYRAPDRFLGWLAGWVGVELARTWDDHQRRRAVAEMVPALGLRGRRDGLTRFLDLYSIAVTRPRIAIDEGARVLFTTPGAQRAAPVHALVGHGPHLRTRDTAAYPGLVRPSCIAATPEGHLLVGDGGLRDATPPGLWRVSRIGAYVDTDDTAPPPRPRPLGTRVAGQPDRTLGRPHAIAVEHRTDPWQAFVLDFDALYRLAPPDLTTVELVATHEELSLFAPDAVLVDRPGHLLVLARGGIFDIDTTRTPPTVQRRLSTAGMVPGAMALFGDHLIVSDLRSQESDPDAADPSPADLVLVDRTDPATWTTRRLLTDFTGKNPLVAPVTLVRECPDALLVLDVGLRPLSGDLDHPFSRVLAEPAAVYRVRLAGADAALRVTGIERVTEPAGMVWPTGMVLLDGILYLSDPGESAGVDDSPLLRDRAGDFAVLVHFSRQRPTTFLDQRSIAHDVASIVESHKPAAAVARRPHSPSDPEEEQPHE